jgi:hypothetical protein
MNPSRMSQGGDVEGEEPIDVSQGEAIKVAKASFDPGYDTANSRDGLEMIDLKQGFCTYGKLTGE